MDSKLYFEDSATSKKHIELAIQQSADQAVEETTSKSRKSFKEMSKEEKLNFFDQRISRLEKSLEAVKSRKAAFLEQFEVKLEETYDTLPELPEMSKVSEVSKTVSEQVQTFTLKPTLRSVSSSTSSLTDAKKQERLQRQEERRKRKEEKIARMSPKSLERYQTRQAELAVRREATEGMTKEEKKAYRYQQRLEKIKKENPEKLEKFLEQESKKKEKREALAKLSIEELKELKEEKKKLAQERRIQYSYLKENWSESIPNGLDHLIIDGNNMRGGGPRRHSRDTIIKHIHESISLDQNLKKSTVTVWFDHKPAQYKTTPGIDVKFSHDQIADDLIVAETQSKVPKKSVLTVTNDRGLALRILNLGGHVMRNKQFNLINPNAPQSRH